MMQEIVIITVLMRAMLSKMVLLTKNTPKYLLFIFQDASRRMLQQSPWAIPQRPKYHPKDPKTFPHRCLQIRRFQTTRGVFGFKNKYGRLYGRPYGRHYGRQYWRTYGRQYGRYYGRHTGDNTGENTGDHTGYNTGRNTGENTGDNT